MASVESLSKKSKLRGLALPLFLMAFGIVILVLKRFTADDGETVTGPLAIIAGVSFCLLGFYGTVLTFIELQRESKLSRCDDAEHENP
jgi:hypothetical protein